jgi:hypothetical protein
MPYSVGRKKIAQVADKWQKVAKTNQPGVKLYS